ncbi:hypothetical protein HDV00_009821 [Rhizophlyctis rosea]|nr:hypothetical protein HDV00_009821 [Rhizophlyctis rosea]
MWARSQYDVAEKVDLTSGGGYGSANRKSVSGALTQQEQVVEGDVSGLYRNGGDGPEIDDPSDVEWIPGAEVDEEEQETDEEDDRKVEDEVNSTKEEVQDGGTPGGHGGETVIVQEHKVEAVFTGVPKPSHKATVLFTSKDGNMVAAEKTSCDYLRKLLTRLPGALDFFRLKSSIDWILTMP